MKISYVLKVFASESTASSGTRPGRAFKANLQKLRKACPQITGRTKTQPTRTVVLVSGNPDAATLKRLCADYRRSGYAVIVVTDAIAPTRGLQGAFSCLEMSGFELATTAGVLSLMKQKNPHLYAYPKADCTSTVCVLLDGGTNALVIIRGHDPFVGCAAFPGGFLRVSLETLRKCGVRELREETGLRVKLSELLLVDERSSPSRDVRGHVVDHGYVMIVSPARQKELLKRLKAGDDAAKVEIVPVSKLLRKRMAFDHKLLLKAALKTLNASR